MWQMQQIVNPTNAPLWFGDGLPRNALRGGFAALVICTISP